ncbi:MAG: HEAT repeat domain-containing protein [Deltaproteobacteria bacterium]|nr:HEAT repeat domain-containing protein [Deltaproteobacteria bacterium]
MSKLKIPLLSLALCGITMIAPLDSYSQSQSAASPILGMLRDARDARTRWQAALMVGRMRPAGAREALIAALRDRDGTVRASAAEGLRSLGDSSAVPALRAALRDSDGTVVSSVTRALAQLDHSSPVAVAPTAVVSASAGPVNWSRTRFVLRMGSLANRADGRANVVEALRSALAQEVGRLDEIAIAPTALPPEAERQVRSGHLRVFAIEGAVQQLRRWSVASTHSVRAEVSLVLMTDPSRAIVGSMSGAATAQNTMLPGQSSETLARELERRALAGAVRGAVANLRSSLSDRH